MHEINSSNENTTSLSDTLGSMIFNDVQSSLLRSSDPNQSHSTQNTYFSEELSGTYSTITTTQVFESDYSSAFANQETPAPQDPESLLQNNNLTSSSSVNDLSTYNQTDSCVCSEIASSEGEDDNNFQNEQINQIFIQESKERMLRTSILYKACENGKEMAIVLNYTTTTKFKDKINFNYKDEDGNTFYHVAIINKHPDIVKALFKSPCNKCVQNKKGKTPKMLCFDSNIREIQALAAQFP